MARDIRYGVERRRPEHESSGAESLRLRRSLRIRWSMEVTLSTAVST